VRKIGCAALALPTAVLLLAACSGAPDTANSSVASTKVVTYTPAPKGGLSQVTWNIWDGEPTTLNPYESANYTPNEINSNMCESLLQLTPSFKIAPALAKSWSNPNPLTWVYNLRPGVKFWDGTTMTAQDVAFSLNVNRTDSATYYNYLFASVKSVTVTGPLQVTVKLKTPDYLFNTEMADYAGIIVEKKFYLEHESNYGSPSVGVMCTGPYQFTSWVKGQSITLTAFPGYWNKARIPKTHTIKFTFLTNEAEITAALETGAIDGTYDLPLSGIKELEKSKEGKVYFGPSQTELTVFYSDPKGPVSNINIRRALQVGIDWAGIGQEVEKGTGVPIRDMIPQSIFASDSAVLNPAYNALPKPQSGNIALAKKYVAKAGAAAKQTIVMDVPAITSLTEFGEDIQSAAQSIGLKFKLRVLPEQQYSTILFGPASGRTGIDMLCTDFWSNVADPLDWIANTAILDTTQNYYGYTGVNSLYERAIATQDPQARAELIKQIMVKAADDLLPLAPGIYHYNTLFMNNRLTGAPASFDYVYYPWAASLGASK
jgi:peptide/nickel transport system substrate-binding protein